MKTAQEPFIADSENFLTYDKINSTFDSIIIFIIPGCVVIATGIARDDFIGTFSERINIIFADQIADFYIGTINGSDRKSVV